MDKDLYWEAQWVILEIEETRSRYPITRLEELSLDLLLQLKP